MTRLWIVLLAFGILNSVQAEDDQAAVASGMNQADNGDMRNRALGSGSTLQAAGGIELAAGSALMAQGMQLMSNPFTYPQGIALFTKGTILVAQGGMFLGAGGQNTDNGVNRMGDVGGTTGASLSATDVVQKVLQDNPNAVSALAANGVNANDFANQILSGQIQDTQQALAASGAQVTPEQAAQVESTANATASSKLAELGLTVDNNAVASGSAGAGANGSGGIAGASSAVGKDGKLLAMAPTDPAKAVRKKGSSKDGSDATAGKDGLADSKGLLDPNSILEGMLKKKNNDPEVAQKLESLGVAQNRARENLFQLARHNYRNFNKWRVAKRQQRSIASQPKGMY